MEDNVKTIVDEIKARQDKSVKTFEDKAADLEKKLEGANAEVLNLAQKVAALSAPAARAVDAKMEHLNKLAQMMIEKKEIRSAATGMGQSGAGNINVAPDIVRGMVDKNRFAKLTRQYWGDYFQTNIPVFLQVWPNQQAP